MPALGKDFAFVTQYIRKLRGGSQPILAQASDGLLYVVKFKDNLQGPNLSFNESAGNELFGACGLAVPSWKPLVLTDSFLDKNPDCWMQTPEGRLRPASGLCFGSRFLGGTDKRLLEVLPGTSYKRVRNRASFWLAWLIDVCAEHADNRQAIFVEDADGWLNASFVDHGHLFGGPNGDLRKSFRASRYLDPYIYPEVSTQELGDFQRVLKALNTDMLWQRAKELPADWGRASAQNSFGNCLHRLAKPVFMQNVLDAITDDHARRTEREPGGFRGERKLPAEVLRLGVQGAGLGQNHIGHPACA